VSDWKKEPLVHDVLFCPVMPKVGKPLHIQEGSAAVREERRESEGEMEEKQNGGRRPGWVQGAG
jgi:hypothetical protein